MVWLFEGYPERPERLRRWFLEGRLTRAIEKRRIQRGRDPFPKDWVERIGRWSRWRRRIASVVSEPGLTITAELSGGVMVAVQFGRLTDPDQSGSLVVGLLGAALVAVGVFVSRSRETYLQKVRDRSESRADDWILRELVEAIEGSNEDLADQIHEEVERLHEHVDTRAAELRVEIDRVRDGRW